MLAGTKKLPVRGQTPSLRGCFAATALPGGMLVHGGNSLSNERLADMYLLDLHEVERSGAYACDCIMYSCRSCAFQEGKDVGRIGACLRGRQLCPGGVDWWTHSRRSASQSRKMKRSAASAPECAAWRGRPERRLIRRRGHYLR
jgi:hypothetical protein